jgi:hypothetical protein
VNGKGMDLSKKLASPNGEETYLRGEEAYLTGEEAYPSGTAP